MDSISLVAENIGKSFGTRRVLRGVSLKIIGGQAVAVTGPNGSGKSTLLKILAGLMRPSSGVVTFVQNGTESVESAVRRALVSYAGPDLTFYPELTGGENLRFFAQMRGVAVTAAQSEEWFASVGLGGRDGDPVSVYSSGMRQRLRLAFARMLNAPILLLDEPSLALDVEGVQLVAETVTRQREKGGITVVATNDPREAELGDWTLTAGSPGTRRG